MPWERSSIIQSHEAGHRICVRGTICTAGWVVANKMELKLNLNQNQFRKYDSIKLEILWLIQWKTSKLLKRLFLARFQPHVTSLPNFNPLQSAYRRFHSTETSLLNTFDQVYTAAEASKPTILVSLDLSAAFDTIDHSTLLSRLETGFGVSGSALNWIRYYLVDRVQRVVVGQAKSGVTSLSTDVQTRSYK